MERNSYMKKLEEWKVSSRRKPLILEGARQVGKTWLMREFSATHYKNEVYVRFDKDVQLRRIFSRDFDIGRIVHELEVAFSTRIDPETTVLLFDEIQACKSALTSLKYFCEDRPDIHVIAAGSLLGLEYRDDEAAKSGIGDEGETTGFPVGKVNTIRVHPMSFIEFLSAMGCDVLSQEIEADNRDLISDFSEKLTDMLRHYFVIGGMPEAVEAYRRTGNLIDVSAVHGEILSGYRHDFAKHAPKGDVAKIKQVWDSLPAQLAKENKKFMYSEVRKGGRASVYREPIEWLVDAGLVRLCQRITKPGLPLSSYADSGFKMFVLDIGLLSAMSSLDSSVILQGSRIFEEFKGALTEQYVFQQLVAEYGVNPFYWSTDDSRTEVDFVVQMGMDIVPVEVKAGGNVKSKSLRSYMERFKPPMACRMSMLSHEEQFVSLSNGGQCRLVNLPLYGLK